MNHTSPGPIEIEQTDPHENPEELSPVLHEIDSAMTLKVGSAAIGLAVGNITRSKELPPDEDLADTSGGRVRQFIRGYRKHLSSKRPEALPPAEFTHPETEHEGFDPLDPKELSNLRLIIEDAVGEETQRAHSRGEHIQNGFSTRKLVDSVTKSYLAKYLGVSDEELEDGSTISPKLIEVIRGLFSLPMHEFLTLAHAMKDPEVRETVFDRDWSRKAPTPRERSRRPHADSEPDEEDLAELDAMIADAIRDEAHREKDSRGVDKLDPDEFKDIVLRVKSSFILNHLGDDATEETIQALDTALFEFAKKRGRVAAKKRPT